jgi:hypothetical protein
MVVFEIIDGPYNVHPKQAGGYFVAEGDLVPEWYPAKFERAPMDAIIEVDLNGVAKMRRSLGAMEHH